MATHEGWKNYETWCVNLWLDNDECLYRDVQRQATYVERTNTDVDAARTELARWLQRFVEGAQPELEGVWSDLMSAALAYVDWDEIAESKIDADNVTPDEDTATEVEP